MSEHVPELPPLPPARPMSEHDWVRLLVRIDVAIAGYRRRQRVRLALVLGVVALLAVAAVVLLR